MNLTNDRKNTNKRTYMTHSFIDVQIYFILSMIFFIVAVKAHLANACRLGAKSKHNAMMCFSVTVMTFKAEFTWFI